MIITTILAMALTTQTPTNEQKRQAELKALAAKIHQENLAKRPQSKAKPAKPTAPVIQYVGVPEVRTGALLYVWNEGLEKVPVCTNFTRLRALQKAMLDGDQAALDDAIAQDRLLYVSREDAVRVVQTQAQTLDSGPSMTLSTGGFMRGLQAAQFTKPSDRQIPACEVRILDGPFKGQTGWVLEYLLRDRVEVSLKKAKRHR